jgi:hypothetical protein
MQRPTQAGGEIVEVVAQDVKEIGEPAIEIKVRWGPAAATGPR